MQTTVALDFLRQWPGVVEDVWLVGDPAFPNPFVVVRLARGSRLVDRAADAVLLCRMAEDASGIRIDHCVVEFSAFASSEMSVACVDRRCVWTESRGRLVPHPSALSSETLREAVSRFHSFA